VFHDTAVWVRRVDGPVPTGDPASA
jgi:hypothetical protein